MVELTQEAVDQVEAILKTMVDGGLGTESARGPIKEVALTNGWDWLLGKTAADFGSRLGPLVQAYSYARYSEDRRYELLSEDREVWIFHAGMACDERHGMLDGLCVAPGHAFWARHYPPHGWSCDCYVTGASSLSMARRLGGDPDKPIPAWCDAVDPVTGGPVGLAPIWADGAPSVRAILEAIPAGDLPE